MHDFQLLSKELYECCYCVYVYIHIGKTVDSNVHIQMSDGCMVNADGSQPRMASFNIFRVITMKYQHKRCSSNFGGPDFYKCR